MAGLVPFPELRPEDLYTGRIRVVPHNGKGSAFLHVVLGRLVVSTNPSSHFQLIHSVGPTSIYIVVRLRLFRRPAPLTNISERLAECARNGPVLYCGSFS